MTPILTIGYTHYLRMNAVRCGFVPTHDEFLKDIRSCIFSYDRSVTLSGTDLKAITKYLTERLTPRRRALPDNYDLSTRLESNR